MSSRAVVTALGDDLFALSFELVNDGPEPVDVPSYEPFLDFTVLATAGGVPVPVEQPALDIGVQAVTIHVPALGAVAVETPIGLRIAGGAEQGTDGFVWTIARPLGELSLRIELTLPAPFAGECELSFR